MLCFFGFATRHGCSGVFEGRSQSLRAIALGLFLGITTALSAAVVVFPATTNVGASSPPQTVSVSITASGRLNAVRVLTAGVVNLDYSISGAGTCSTGNFYSVGQTCSFPVTFSPEYPGQRFGAVLLVDISGNVLGATSLLGTGSGPLLLFIPGTINTVAGNAAWIYRQDGLPATQSPIFLPFGIAVDGGGNLFIADSSNDRIRRVDATSGLMSTVAGNGSVGTAGDGGPATSASINQPSSVVLDGAGNLYFSDSANNAVRRVDGSTGIITTVAGTLGAQGYSGDGGQATSALLNAPDGIALDGMGNLYIADTANNVVRVVDLASGVIHAFAGNHVAAYQGDGGQALSASLNNPWSVTVSAFGEVYIADQNNHCIRKVAINGSISTITGNGAPGFAGDGGAASAAILNSPSTVLIDVAGNVYISDSGNNRVRKINASSGVVTTVVGNATETFSGDGGPADQAGLYGPYGMAIDGAGNLFISDVFHNRIREVTSVAANLVYPVMRVDRVSATQDQMLENDGNAALNFATIQANPNTQLDPAATTCSSSTAVQSALTCVIGAQFAPTVTGNPVRGSITLTSDSPTSPQTIHLSGQVLTLDPSTAVVISSGSPSALGAPVTFTATLTSTGVKPTGTVTFLDGATSIGTGILNGSGITTLTTASLALGTHAITASYAGDTNNAPAVSKAVSQVVKNGTSVLLQSSLNPSSALSPITLTATATGVSSTPTGTVTFLDGAAPLGTATLDGSGVATFNISTLSVGSHLLKASYGGDAQDLTNVSLVVTQVVTKSSTSTALSSSNTSATFSTSIIYTATITSQTAGVASGSVTFKDGSATIGTGTLNSSGVATLTLSNQAVGSHPISASYGGDSNNGTSSSALVSETIAQIGTSTVLTSSVNPSPAGGNVQFTATITALYNPPSSPLTGSVVFTDGAATLGTTNVSGGVATLNVAALSIGTHNLVAVYSGATDYAGSTATTLSQVVQLSVTTETLAAAPTPGIAGRTVTLTASITSGGSTPTGAVTFKDGTNNLGQGTLNAQGIATFATTTLAAGTHSITGAYAGDSNNQPMTQTISVVVNQATTGVLLATSGTPATVGLPITLRATTTGNGGTPSGSVSFFDGPASLGSAQMDGSGLASLVVASLAVGTHTLTATYSGDPNDATSNSNSLTEVIQKTTTTTTLTTASDTILQGTSVQFAAQVSSNAAIPGGTIQFFDGTTLIGTSTLNAAGVAVLNLSNLLVGQHSITAVYSGDANDNPSTSASLAQVVQPITIVGLTSNFNPASMGATLTFTAGVSGANTIPTGTITFKDGSIILGVSTINGAGVATLTTAALSAGSHSITASYPGDGNNSSSVSAVYTQVLQQASTQTVLGLISNIASYGSAVTLSTTVTGSGGIPTGSVSFLDGATTLGTANLTAGGTAVFTVSTLGLGQHILTAVYGGDQNDGASTSAPQTLTIQKQTVSLSILSNSNPSLGGLTVAFTAALQTSAGTPTGTVTWSDGGVLLATTSVAGNGASSYTTSSLVPGQHSITATYSGDSTNGSATSSPLVETIQQATSAITLTSNQNPGLAGIAITYSVAVTGTGAQPGGNVTIKNGAATVGTITVDGNGLGAVTTSSLPVGSNALTAVYAGDTFHLGSQSALLTEVVLQGTTSTIASSNNPSFGGASVTFTATIFGSGSGSGTAITGTITFRDGSTVLGSSPLSAGGVATYTTTLLTPGQHSITASYSGDSLNQPSVTAVLVQTVQTVSTTTTLAATPNPATINSAITLTAHVTGTGASTGSVNFLDGSNVIGTGVVAAGGIATFTTSTLAPGQHILLAIYEGDTDHLTSTSNPLVQAVLQPTTATLSSSANPSLAGAVVTLMVAIKNGTNTAAPTGLVTLMDGPTALGAVALSASGGATFSTASLAAGQHTITATYSGDGMNGAATSNPLVQAIQQAASATTLTSNQNPGLVGSPISYSVAVTGTSVQPGGIVTIKNGSAILGTVIVDANGLGALTNSSLPVGSNALTAVYAGDANHSGSQSAPLTEVILQGSASTLASSINPSLGGNPVTFTAAVVVAGNTSITGTVTFRDGATVLAISPISAAGEATYTTSQLTPGQHSITASYSGDSLNQPSLTPALVQTVQTVSTTTTLSSSAGPAIVYGASVNPVILGSGLTLTAQVGGVGNTPTGTVTFLDGSTTIGSGVVAAGGVATLTISTLAPGQHILLAIYAGDSDHLTSTSNPLLQPVLQHTSTTLSASSNPSLAGNATSFAVSVGNGASTAMPTGSVSLMDGSIVMGTAVLSANGTASFTMSSLAVGPHAITAVYAGDTQNLTSPSPMLTEIIELHASTNVLTASSASIVVGQSATLTATLTGNGAIPPSGTVVFTSGTTTLGTAPLNSSGIATLLASPAIGSYTLTATYAGDSLYSGSTSSPFSLAVLDTTHFTIALTPATLSLPSKQHSTIQVTLTSIQNFADMLALGCVGLPQAATCTFSSDQSALTANGTQTVSLTIDTGSPLTAGGLASASSPQQTGLPAGVALCLLPGGILFLFVARRWRRAGRVLGGGLMALLLVAMSMAMTGCGALNVNGTPPGSYTFNVTAIGSTTAATQSAPMTLTVTQ